MAFGFWRGGKCKSLDAGAEKAEWLLFIINF